MNLHFTTTAALCWKNGWINPFANENEVKEGDKIIA
jgi:hypothetical protein